MTALSKQNTAAFKKTVSASAADHEGGGGVCATIEVLVCNHAYLNYAFPDIWSDHMRRAAAWRLSNAKNKKSNFRTALWTRLQYGLYSFLINSFLWVYTKN